MGHPQGFICMVGIDDFQGDGIRLIGMRLNGMESVKVGENKELLLKRTCSHSSMW